MDFKLFRATANGLIISKFTYLTASFCKPKVCLLLFVVIACYSFAAPAVTEESPDLQELWREYRTTAIDAASHRGRLLEKVKSLFERAPLWWRYQIDVMAEVADAADTPLLWPKDYRALYEGTSRKPYRASVDCGVPEEGDLVSGDNPVYIGGMLVGESTTVNWTLAFAEIGVFTLDVNASGYLVTTGEYKEVHGYANVTIVEPPPDVKTGGLPRSRYLLN